MSRTASVVLLSEQGEGVQTDQFSDRETFTVNTENTAYEITIMHGATGDVQVRGGRHFPSKTRCTLLGASGGALLKVRSVSVGLNMEFLHEGRRIVTSPVCSIAIGY